MLQEVDALERSLSFLEEEGRCAEGALPRPCLVVRSL